MLHKIKTAKTRVFASIRAAVIGTASVIVLAAMLSACKQGNGPGGGGNTPAPEQVTVAVTGDEGVIVKNKASFSVPKGSTWITVKTSAKAKVSYKDGYKADGWKLENANGADLENEDIFNENVTVFAVSKKKDKPSPEPSNITITVQADSGYELKTPASFEAASGAKWADIKANAEAKVSLKEGYTALGWKLGGASGADLDGSHTFTESTIVFAVSKQNGAPAPEKITITVKGDDGVELAAENTFKADKNAEWKNIKASAMGKITVKENYEFAEWRLNGKTGEVLTDTKTFAANATVFAVTKSKTEPSPNTVNYKVEHWQQNITNNEYTKIEADTENKTGTTDENTAAQAKTYTGFTAKPITQEKIKADGSTVIKVYYDRNIITLTLDLQGGFSIIPLEDGNKLKGKFGARVNFTSPVKAGYTFTGWNPALSETFPAENSAHTAQWQAKTNIPYKVEHWQQNIENDEYTKIEAETKKGATDAMTEAQAKTYAGFTAKPITQEKIKVNGKTVVKVYYDRNIITLTLNLDGGTTSTQLEDGNKLKGKFGAAVTVADPEKSGVIFGGWEPELPDTFPAENSAYKAQWSGSPIVKIAGDERTQIPEGSQIKLTGVTTWENIKAQVTAKVSLKAEWQGGDYEVYEWRLKDGTGEKLTDGYTVNKSITVYAVTNYAKFSIEGNKISGSKGYTGDKPRGKIIIPEGITEIEAGSIWGGGAFNSCTGITSVQLPQSLTAIGGDAFDGCTEAIVSLPASVQTIERGAFGDNYSNSYCKKVIAPNYELFKKVLDSGYPKGRIELLGRFEENGLYYSDSRKTMLIGCAGSLSGNISIPSTVVIIAELAFANNTKITGVDLSGCTSLTAIKWDAFYGCTGLTSAVFADKNGWAVYDDYGCNNKHRDIQPSNLENTAIAAEYLRSTYRDKYWKKN